MVCILPVGSYEQHGPHLPPTVDTEVAQHVARRLAGEIKASVLPPIYYTCSREHSHFPNTIWVNCRSFLQYFEDVLRSAVEKCGVVIVVAGHGGVKEAVALVASQLNYEVGPKALALNIWDFIKARDHAGTDETSIYLASGGALTGEMVEICEGDVSLFGKMAIRTKTGVVGCLNPREVSLERGRSLLEPALGKMLEKIRDFLQLSPS
ncbi:MAG: creatininase family protein [Pyrobaculum sp.]